jgi:hypothetical protein
MAVTQYGNGNSQGHGDYNFEQMGHSQPLMP